MLYIATGDGGSANDPKNYAQNLQSLLGKLLRIDVRGQSGYGIPGDNHFVGKDYARPEIYSYGLRNPWRCHWEGDMLYIADVGQNHLEEVDLVSRKKLRGANFGWRLREGTVATPKKKVGGESPEGAILPILTYPHDNSKDPAGFSITGGVVYGGKIKEMVGRYFFADYVSNRIWSFKAKGGKVRDVKNHNYDTLPDTGKIGGITSFSRGLSGEVYVICRHGEIFLLSEK